MASVPLSVLVEGPAMASVLVKKAAISACEEGRLESWLHSSARRMLARLSLKSEVSRGPATLEKWLGSLMKPSGRSQMRVMGHADHGQIPRLSSHPSQPYLFNNKFSSVPFPLSSFRRSRPSCSPKLSANLTIATTLARVRHLQAGQGEGPMHRVLQ